MNDVQMLERVATEVRNFVERRFAPMTAEITCLRDAMEQQAEAHAREVEGLKRSLSALELKQGPAGKDGANGKDGRDGVDGKDGRDGNPGANGKDGNDGVNGRDGADGLAGKDGRDGIDGKNGADGLAGKDGAAGVGIARVELDPDLRHFDIVLEDGKSFEIELPAGAKGEAGRNGTDGRDGKDGRDGLHGKDGSAGRDGIDGKDGAPGKNGERGLRGEAGADGIDGRDGSDGLHGKDGLQIDDFDAAIIDGRTLELSLTLSDGLVKTKQLPLSGMVVDRGVFRAGAKHTHGDAVTFAGSYWIAQCDTENAPGSGSPDWRLAVKKGRDGKDAPGAEE